MADRFEAYRNVEVEGIFGKFIIQCQPVPIEIVEEVWNDGEGVALDLMPHEFWYVGDVLRFGEEFLGKDF